MVYEVTSGVLGGLGVHAGRTSSETSARKIANFGIKFRMLLVMRLLSIYGYAISGKLIVLVPRARDADWLAKVVISVGLVEVGAVLSTVVRQYVGSSADYRLWSGKLFRLGNVLPDVLRQDGLGAGYIIKKRGVRLAEV